MDAKERKKIKTIKDINKKLKLLNNVYTNERNMYMFNQSIEIYCITNCSITPEKTQFKMIISNKYKLIWNNGVLVFSIKEMFLANVPVLLLLLCIGFTKEQMITHCPPETHTLLKRYLIYPMCVADFNALGLDKEIKSGRVGLDENNDFSKVNKLSDVLLIGHIEKTLAISLFEKLLHRRPDLYSNLTLNIPRTSANDKLKYAMNYIRLHILPQCLFNPIHDDLPQNNKLTNCGKMQYNTTNDIVQFSKHEQWNTRKFLLLSDCITRLLYGNDNQRQYSSRDDYAEKRFNTVGIAFTQLVHNFIRVYVRVVRSPMKNTSDEKIKTRVQNAIRSAITVGNFTATLAEIGTGKKKTTGAFIVYNIQNNNTARIQLNTCKTPSLSSNESTTHQRKYTSNRKNETCQFSTPEGKSIGMRDVLCERSIITPPHLCVYEMYKYIYEICSGINTNTTVLTSNAQHSGSNFDSWKARMGAFVYFNNSPIMMTNNPTILAYKLRDWRRKCFLVGKHNNRQVNIDDFWKYGTLSVSVQSHHFDLKYTHSVEISVDADRIMTPYIFIDTRNGYKGLEYLDNIEKRNYKVMPNRRNTLRIMKRYINNNGSRYPITFKMSSMESNRCRLVFGNSALVYYEVDDFVGNSYQINEDLRFGLNHTLMVRGLYGYSQSKAACGPSSAILSGDNERKRHVLMYPQKPLVYRSGASLNYLGIDDSDILNPMYERTRLMKKKTTTTTNQQHNIGDDETRKKYVQSSRKLLGVLEYLKQVSPNGFVPIIAISGYQNNEDDCILVNRNMVQFGGGSTLYFRRETQQEGIEKNKKNTDQSIENRNFAKQKVDGNDDDDDADDVVTGSYKTNDAIEESVKSETFYTSGDIIQTKSVKQVKFNMTVKKNLTLGKEFLGVKARKISETIYKCNDNNNTLRTVYDAHFCYRNDLSDGDKLSDGNGLKGTAKLVDNRNMYFTSDGTVAGLCIGANCFTKRQTSGLIIEMLFSKAIASPMRRKSLVQIKKEVANEIHNLDKNTHDYWKKVAKLKKQLQLTMKKYKTLAQIRKEMVDKISCIDTTNQDHHRNMIKMAKQMLHESGFSSRGLEPAISGHTGRQLRGGVYMGPCSFKVLMNIARLVQMNRGSVGGAKDRSTGDPVKIKGSNSGAGIKLNGTEMEGMVIHGCLGMYNFEREKLIANDNVEAVYCGECKFLGDLYNITQNKHRMVCSYDPIHHVDHLKMIQISGRLRKIYYELMAQNIHVKFDIKKSQTK